ncbi:MAG TPA: hypothetical protein VN963_08730, partial [bacterium]|nr:hypothetical protein [bacterium]
VNLSKHKPFDKEKIKENYKNIKVSWVLKFHSLSIINEKRVRIAATEVDFKNKLHSLPVAIFFDIDISNQPEIKLMNKGEGILVSGEIEKASEFDIDLKNCTIKII